MNLSPANKIKTVDLSHVEINFFDVLRDMQAGKVKSVYDLHSEEICFVPEKLYKQLLKEAA